MHAPPCVRAWQFFAETSVCVLVELMYACACISVAEEEEEGEEGMLVMFVTGTSVTDRL